MTSRGEFINRSDTHYKYTEFKEGYYFMSGALWCDKGEHAFSAKDENRQHFTRTANVEIPTGNSFGRTTYQTREEVTEELDICGPCWKSGNDFETRKAEIPPLPPEQMTLDEMEKQNTDWQAGYDAAMDQIATGRHG